MNYTLKRIEPGSVARLAFFLLAIIGGVVGIIGYIFAVIGSLFSGSITAFFLSLIGGLLLAIILVAFYAAMGAAFGWIYCFIYNFLAKKFGGIVIELVSKESK